MANVKILSLFLFISLMLVQLCTIIPSVGAAQNSEDISGAVTIIPGDIIGGRQSGIVIHTYAVQNATFVDSLVGDVVVYWHILQYATGEMKTVGTGTFYGTLTFNGKVMSGTFTFITVGQGFGWNFYNEWRIIKGTGDLSNIHGKGILEGDLVGLTGSYSGSVFFSR